MNHAKCRIEIMKLTATAPKYVMGSLNKLARAVDDDGVPTWQVQDALDRLRRADVDVTGFVEAFAEGMDDVNDH